MLKMDRAHVVRHKIEVVGKSIRAVALELHHSRNTIQKYLQAPSPVRQAYSPRTRLVQDEVRPRIDALIAAWKTNTTDKQRITAARLHAALVEDGCQVGLTTVTDYVRELKLKGREVFIPLVWIAGDAAEVDFFEVTVDLASERIKVWLFLMRMMFSGKDFVWLYRRADQISFLDAHVRAFEYFGAVPTRAIYDNLKAAVTKIVLPQRELSARFVALTQHYLYEPCCARPYQGHDKGGVESRGKGIRLAHMVPIPQGDTLEEIARTLLNKVELQGQQRRDQSRDNQTPAERFVHELPRMINLVPQRFEARQTQLCTASRSAKVKVNRAWYSVPSSWASRDVTARIGVEQVELRCGQEVVEAPVQPSGGSYIGYRHYLPELARKPQAIRQVAGPLLEELGAPFGQLWRLLVDAYGPRDAARRFARVLKAIVEQGEDKVARRVAHALQSDSLEELHLTAPQSEPPEVPLPEGLDEVDIETVAASSFDTLLGGGWHE